MKQFKVTCQSYKNPLACERSKYVEAESKFALRRNWHNIIGSDEYSITHIEEVEGIGLRVRTVSGDEFDILGPVTSKDFPEDGGIYYCAGRSFHESIVIEVILDADERKMTA